MQKRERNSHCPVPGCDYLSYSVHGIQAHVRLNHPSYAPTESNFICPVCLETRTSLSAVVTHLEMTHPFEDYDNPTADYRLMEGLLRHLAYAEKLAEFERRYPEAA